MNMSQEEVEIRVADVVEADNCLLDVASLVIRDLVHMVQEDAKYAREANKARKAKSVWVRKWLLKRTDYGQYENPMQQLEEGISKSLKKFMTIDPDMFCEHVVRLTRRINKQDTYYKKALEPGQVHTPALFQVVLLVPRMREAAVVLLPSPDLFSLAPLCYYD